MRRRRTTQENLALVCRLPTAAQPLSLNGCALSLTLSLSHFHSHTHTLSLLRDLLFALPQSLPTVLRQAKPAALCSFPSVPVPDTPKQSSRLPRPFFFPPPRLLTSAVTSPSAQEPRRFNFRGLFHNSANSACRDPAPLPTYCFRIFLCREALAATRSSEPPIVPPQHHDRQRSG